MAKKIKTFYGDYYENELVAAFEKAIEDYSDMSVRCIEKEATIKEQQGCIEELAGLVVELMCEASELKNGSLSAIKTKFGEFKDAKELVGRYELAVEQVQLLTYNSK